MSTPTITLAENGPYLVTGCESLCSADGTVHPSEGRVALCRCGGSKNKPFCDGSHKHNGFSSARADDRTPDQVDTYTADGITIRDNRGVCAHAGRCTDGLPAVFRLRQEPFVDPAGAEPAAIVEVVRQCPSGALTAETTEPGPPPERSAPMVFVAPNGPYAVMGGCALEGVELGAGQTGDPITLCRCGQSKNKPFCNGAHWNHQFDEHAPKPDDA